jgi:hypothetical protein
MDEASLSKPNHPACRRLRRDGQPCRSPALSPSGYCFGHDPDRVDERAEAHRRGGQNHSNAARLRGLVPPRLVSVYDTLEKALEEVHDDKLDPRQASAMAAIARAMVAVLSAGELEERVRSLEGKTE